MDDLKWNKYNSIIMLVGTLICIYSRYNIVRQKKKKIFVLDGVRFKNR